MADEEKGRAAEREAAFHLEELADYKEALAKARNRRRVVLSDHSTLDAVVRDLAKVLTEDERRDISMRLSEFASQEYERDKQRNLRFLKSYREMQYHRRKEVAKELRGWQPGDKLG